MGAVSLWAEPTVNAYHRAALSPRSCLNRFHQQLANSTMAALMHDGDGTELTTSVVLREQIFELKCYKANHAIGGP
jgi:hypothetical protein